MLSLLEKTDGKTEWRGGIIQLMLGMNGNCDLQKADVSVISMEPACSLGKECICMGSRHFSREHTCFRVFYLVTNVYGELAWFCANSV